MFEVMRERWKVDGVIGSIDGGSVLLEMEEYCREGDRKGYIMRAIFEGND